MSRYYLLSGLSFVLLFTGCGQSGFVAKRENIQDAVVDRSYSPKVVKDLELLNRGLPSRLFYLLNRGMLSFAAGETDSSLFYWNAAERVIDDQYTKRVSQKITSMVSNEYAVNYEGYPIEHLMLHFFKSLAYMQKENLSAALVEMRKMNLRFTYLEDHPEPYKLNRTQFPYLNTYAGILSWMAGEDNDAEVFFRLAGMDYDSLKAESPLLFNRTLVIEMNGLIQELVEAYIQLIVTTESDIHSLKIANPVIFNRFPDYHVENPLADTNRIGLSSEISLNDQFSKEFEIREATLGPERTTRAVTKFLLSSGVTTVTGEILENREEEREKQREEGEEVDEANGLDTFLAVLWVGGQIMKVANTITEKADLRQWFTLPASMSFRWTETEIPPNGNVLFRTPRVIVLWFEPGRRLNYNPRDFEKTEHLDFSGVDLDDKD